MNFEKRHESLTVRHILDLHAKRQLELSPGFQRDSVWTDKDRKALIDTVLRGMPLPNIFLWVHKEGRRQIYDVIDGKQRIESLIAFTRHRAPITVKFDPEGDAVWKWGDPYEWTWKEIQQTEKAVAKRFLDYELPIVIVHGGLTDIEKVFIRINSTGKKLTRQEVRHAEWYRNSPLLQHAEAIAKEKKYANYFLRMEILSPGQLSRMKATELVMEMMLTIDREDVLDRKKALDKVMGKEAINGNTLHRIAREVRATFDLVKKVFPDLHTSRFKNASDFYALFFALWKMKKDGYVFTDKRANALAFYMLNELGLELAKYRDAFRQGKGKALNPVAQQYHATVLQGTDTARHRRMRVQIMEGILRPIFPRKDSKRLFSEEQKQLLWHSSKDKVCSNQECREVLSWRDVRMDHIVPHAKGGRTDLGNGQILCVTCNARKSDK